MNGLRSWKRIPEPSERRVQLVGDLVGETGQDLFARVRTRVDSNSRRPSSSSRRPRPRPRPRACLLVMSLQFGGGSGVCSGEGGGGRGEGGQLTHKPAVVTNINSTRHTRMRCTQVRRVHPGYPRHARRWGRVPPPYAAVGTGPVPVSPPPDSLQNEVCVFELFLGSGFAFSLWFACWTRSLRFPLVVATRSRLAFRAVFKTYTFGVYDKMSKRQCK